MASARDKKDTLLLAFCVQNAKEQLVINRQKLQAKNVIALANFLYFGIVAYKGAISELSTEKPTSPKVPLWRRTISTLNKVQFVVFAGLIVAYVVYRLIQTIA